MKIAVVSETRPLTFERKVNDLFKAGYVLLKVKALKGRNDIVTHVAYMSEGR